MLIHGELMFFFQSKSFRKHEWGQRGPARWFIFESWPDMGMQKRVDVSVDRKVRSLRIRNRLDAFAHQRKVLKEDLPTPPIELVELAHHRIRQKQTVAGEKLIFTQGQNAAFKAHDELLVCSGP